MTKLFIIFTITKTYITFFYVWDDFQLEDTVFSRLRYYFVVRKKQSVVLIVSFLSHLYGEEHLFLF